MFCIIYQSSAYRKKHLIKYENDIYAYYELFCKKFTKKTEKRLKKKLDCPIVFCDSIDTSQFRLLLLENVIVILLKKHAGARVALVGHPEPDCLLKRIAPFSKEIHLIHSGEIDESYYLQKFGCAPVKMQSYATQEIIYEYLQGSLYFRGKKIVLPESGYLLPIDVAEMMPSQISELAFLNLLWKFSGLKAEAILPSETVFKNL